MRVTHQSIADVISHIFSSKPQIFPNYVSFGLISAGDTYKTEVTISIEILGDEHDGIFEQNMEIWFWFCNKDGDRLNFNKYTPQEMYTLLHLIQPELRWGTLGPDVEESIFRVGLYRCISIDTRDVAKALYDGKNCNFIQKLNHLRKEWELLSPILIGVAAEQITNFEHISLFFEHTETEQ